ncbi:MFS transporter [Thalassococcus sp. S3]|uniref:MFS transporter n=1 Tax=Thalassococcus sp. S3 TaxID=2017482 RepID=UPI00102413F1|nr:MFS transporter [Thalassococcus sp. S3]QBF29642.1 hypothetical protein CFI11_00230 [Thalassococcus sp. S3]
MTGAGTHLPAGTGRKDGLVALSVSAVFAFDLFAVLPLLVHTAAGKDLLIVPLFLSVRSIAIMILLIPAGRLIDVYSTKLLIPLACIAKAAGFYLACTTESASAFIASAILLGIGTSITRPAMKAIIANIRSTGEAQQIFAWQSVVLNAAAIGGPAVAQLSVLADQVDAMFSLLIGAEVLMAALTFRWLRVAEGQSTGKAAAHPAELAKALKGKLSAVYARQVLAGCAMTIALSFVLTDERFSGAALAFQAICLILIQLVLIRAAFARYERYETPALIIAMVAALVVSSDAPVVVFAGLAVLAAAEAILVPSLHQKIADRSSSSGTATPYALLSLSQTFGEMLGGLVATLLIGAAMAGLNLAIVYGAAAGAIAVMLFLGSDNGRPSQRRQT